ncbi:MAG: aminotransferase class V-fold PLP-dependent enzyme [Holosporaceae bacterium]|nr:aminotransferase class V-fold PLP-dependent enzyme [Holosporaceae bacterium]
MNARVKKLFCLLLFLTSCSHNGSSRDYSDVKTGVFLDYAASYRVNDLSLAEFEKVSRMDGNSSGVNPHAKALKNIEENASRIIAAKIGAKPEQILFTSSATISNNIAILGVAYKNPGCHFISSKIEHKSVLNIFKHLENNGYSVTYLDVDRYGDINLDQLRKSIRPNTKLISIQTLNSEIGAIQNINAIGQIAKDSGVLFHSDGAQAFCKYDIDVNEANLDFFTISGHKIGAPKGVAALYVRDRSKIQPIFFGSGDDLFPGTKSTALMAAFAAAVGNFRFDRAKIDDNFHLLISKLLAIDDIYINSTRPSHIISVSIGGVLLKDVLERMSEYSFSAGCSCIGQGQSNVILAIDPEKKLPSCTIRISFSDAIDSNSLADFAEKLKTTVEQLRQEKDISPACSVDKQKQNSLNQRLQEIQKLLKQEPK